MKIILATIFFVVALFGSAFSADPAIYYKPGDVVDFRIEHNGKIIGTQTAKCDGMKPFDSDSLYYFHFATKTVFERNGRTFDLDVAGDAGYLRNGLPRHYKFDLSLLTAKVIHEGRFSATEYFGTTSRLGVEQPFNIKLTSWPLLLDNNFALQWELAAHSLPLSPGDSIRISAMIPQLNQHVPVTIFARPLQNITYEGQSIRVRVFDLRQVHQVFYLDESGRLLKAEDSNAGISVIREAPGQASEVARESLISLIGKRLWGYVILLLIGVVCFVSVGYSHAKRGTAWLSFVIAAALYWASLELLKPVQEAYFGWAITPQGSTLGSYGVLLGSALVFAIIEMITIAIPTVGIYYLRKIVSFRFALAIGAAAGAGFGFMQATNLTAFGPDGLFVSGADVIQKVGLIGICAICGALIAIITASRKPLFFFLIPIGIKMLLNWMPVFIQKEIMSTAGYAVASLVLMLIAYVVLLRVKKGLRSQRGY